MRRFSSLFLPLSFIWLICSCQPDQDHTLSGSWLGAHMQLDQDYYPPLTQYIHVVSDMAFVTDLVSMKRDTFSIAVQSDTLFLDTLSYDSTQFTINGSWWKYRKPYTTSLHRVSPHPLEWNRIQLRNRIQSQSWSSPWGMLTLLEGGHARLFPDNTNNFHQFCWSLREEDDMIFFLLHGNHTDCEQWSFPPCQILDIEENEFTVKYAEKNEIRTHTFRKSRTPEQPRPVDFQLCNRHLYLNLGSHHYYYKGTELYGGHYHIWKKLNSEFKPIPNGFSGIIRIRFVVNCEGKTGHFETVAMDQEFHLLKKLPPEAESLLNITKQLGPWQPGTSDPRGLDKLDTFIFIAYKLKDGQVVDLLP